MAKKLIKNAETVITMDEQRRELKNCSILIEDKVIKAIGSNLDVSEDIDEVIDGAGMWVFPGLINTHHHFYQTLTRAILKVQNVELFSWLKNLYPLWRNLTADAVYTGTLIALGELLKTGCTTSVDHHYVFPKNASGKLIDEQIRAAHKIGARFHPCRGSMSLSEKDGGLPPDSVVQNDEEILKDSQRLIEEYHDPKPQSMCQIVLAPCSPFSVTPNLMKETAKLAREYGVQCHTHLAETEDENEFCLSKFGMRPLGLMESVGWLGEDIWFAHGVHFSDQELEVLKSTGTGVAHCPVSNQKLASGVARIPEMMEQGIKVGLAVDGSASNDSSDMIGELKAAFLLHRITSGIDAISCRQVLELSTRGSAKVLGRDDIGSLAVGKSADLFMVNKNRLEFAGCFDPVTALVTCGNDHRVDLTMVNGQIVVKDGKLLNIDENKLVDKANQVAKKLVGVES